MERLGRSDHAWVIIAAWNPTLRLGRPLDRILADAKEAGMSSTRFLDCTPGHNSTDLRGQYLT
jgi:hypothetical protein